MTSNNPPLKTTRLSIVDDEGKERIGLSFERQKPTIQLFREDGSPALIMTLDSAQHPSVHLLNPDSTGPTIVLEVDNKGSHVKMDRPGGASSYLFLNDKGDSGVSLIDTHGVRRLLLLLKSDSTVTLQQLDDQGRPSSVSSQP